MGGLNLGVISLVAILVAIVLSFWRKANCGIIAIGLALILGKLFNITDKNIISGFDSSLFLTMAGVTYLFSIIRQNGTLELLANKLMNPFRKKVWLIPVMMYVVGFLLCAVGPGAIPNLAIIPLIAVSIADSVGLNPIMLSIMGVAGIWGARMSPITPEGILVVNLLAKSGVHTTTAPIWQPLFIISIIMAILPFIYYKGWKTHTAENAKENELPKFNQHQILSIAGLVIMIVLALAFNINVGLLAFLIGSILVMLGAADEGKSIKNIPWNVLFLVVGVGMLMKIVVSSGGIDIMSKGFASIMSQHTGSAIMEIIAGVMSFFSSGLGVVFPTLLPTVSGISAQLGGTISPVELGAAVVIGGTITGLSPVSTAGALIMAATTPSDAKEKNKSSKLFVELFAWAFVALFVGAIVALAGIYRLFA